MTDGTTITVGATLVAVFALWVGFVTFDSRYAKSHNVKDALQTLTNEIAAMRLQNEKMMERYIQSIERHAGSMERVIAALTKIENEWDGEDRRTRDV